MKAIIELCRSYHDEVTVGTVYFDGVFICHSIELPWHHNMVARSCIPEGTYPLQWRHSERFGDHIHVTDVPGRKWILLHPANDAKKELRGCIAPVMEVSGTRGLHSRLALGLLLRNIRSVGIQHCSLKIASQ
jgi:hypothetical protein